MARLEEFTYTKANGDTSRRAVIVTSTPSNKVAGYDTTELDNDSFSDFLIEFNALLDRQKQEFAELIAKHDLKHNYRQFIPDNMSDITVSIV